MSTLGLIAALSAAMTWGVVYTLDQRILSVTSPIVLLLINSIATSLVLSPALISQTLRKSIATVSHSTWLAIAASLVLAALANALIFTAIRSLGASKASIFEILYPLFVVIFSFAAYRDRPSSSFLIGAAFVLIGSAIVVASRS